MVAKKTVKTTKKAPAKKTTNKTSLTSKVKKTRKRSNLKDYADYVPITTITEEHINQVIDLIENEYSDIQTAADSLMLPVSKLRQIISNGAIDSEEGTKSFEAWTHDMLRSADASQHQKLTKRWLDGDVSAQAMAEQTRKRYQKRYEGQRDAELSAYMFIVKHFVDEDTYFKITKSCMNLSGGKVIELIDEHNELLLEG